MKPNSLLRYGFRPVLLSSVGRHKAFLPPPPHGTKTIPANPDPFFGLNGHNCEKEENGKIRKERNKKREIP